MDRVDLAWQFGKSPQRRWRNGGEQSSHTTSVSFGRLKDGRWYAERVGYQADADDRQFGACVFSADEQGRTLAWRMTERWRGEATWVEEPAVFGPRGVPTDGRRWRRWGGTWVLDD